MVGATSIILIHHPADQDRSYTALIAHSLIPDNSYTSPGLPDDQWQREAQRWFETGLAKFQYNAMEFPNVSYPKLYVKTRDSNSGITLAKNFTQIPELDEILSSQCGRQRVKLNGRGQNVSVLGLVILLVATVALFLVAKLLALWWDWPEPANERRKQWQQDHLLALWRLARGLPEEKSRLEGFTSLIPQYIPLNRMGSGVNSGP